MPKQQQHAAACSRRGQRAVAAMPLHSLCWVCSVRMQTSAPGHAVLSICLLLPPFNLQACRIRPSSPTSGRRAASSRRPVVSVPRVATSARRSLLGERLCYCVLLSCVGGVCALRSSFHLFPE